MRRRRNSSGWTLTVLLAAMPSGWLQTAVGVEAWLEPPGQYRWYSQKTKDAVADFLGSYDDLRSVEYRVRILVWVDINGKPQFRLE